MNIVVGLCGDGQRFQSTYHQPKWTIQYRGKTMIEWAVLTSRLPTDNLYFVVRQDHLTPHYLNILQSLGQVITTPTKTPGPAHTALLAKPHLHPHLPFISLNCDQWMNWDPRSFLHAISSTSHHYLLTYYDTSPKASYARTLANTTQVDLVVEKQPISTHATAGIYHWHTTSTFFQDCQQLVNDGITTNGESYIAPIYNYAIARGEQVHIWPLSPGEFFPTGTPHDLNTLLDSNII